MAFSHSSFVGNLTSHMFAKANPRSPAILGDELHTGRFKRGADGARICGRCSDHTVNGLRATDCHDPEVRFSGKVGRRPPYQGPSSSNLGSRDSHETSWYLIDRGIR